MDFFIFSGIQLLECNINNCDLDYCPGNGCIKCVDRYYLSVLYCYQCPTNCLKCDGSSSCIECVPGKHGPTCDQTCPIACPACTGYSACTTRIVGRWDAACNDYCPLGCTDILCGKENGKCSFGCRNGYYQSGVDCVQWQAHCMRCSNNADCNSCEVRYFGTYCQITCPMSCANSVCHKDLGHCIEGCATGFHQEGTECKSCPFKCMSCDDGTSCSLCKSGNWGSYCQYNCPFDCYRCTKDGQCITGMVNKTTLQ